jgi:hypothetical protein
MDRTLTGERPAAPRWETSRLLSDLLLSPRPRGFDTLAVVPSNVRAVESGLLFANGLSTLVALIGPSGWGKTHVLEATANRILCERGPRACELWNAAEWVVAGRSKGTSSPLLLDNVQDALGRARMRQQLRLALERRVKAGWPTMLSFTESRLSRLCRSALPSYRDWNVAMIREPDAAEREVLVNHMAENEGVVMAVELRRILAHRLDGNGRTLIGALKRLRLNGSKWITPEHVLRACGILNPFFAADSAWDLRDHVLECASSLESEHPNAKADLIVYVLLRVAQLCEVDVARYLAIEPARAYASAQRVEAQLAQDPLARREFERFIVELVSGLQPA